MQIQPGLWLVEAKRPCNPMTEAHKLPSLKRRLLAGGAWALGGRIGTVFSALATNALLARLLTPRELGAYFLAFSLVMFGAQAGSLGLNQAVVRFVAESLGLDQPGRARRVVTLVLSIGALGTLGVGFAYSLFGDVLAKNLFHSPALVAVTGLVAGWMMVMTFQLLLSETFRGFHDINLATVFGGLASGAILTACLGVLWLLKEQATLANVVLLAIGSGLASSLLAGWTLNRKIARLPSKGVESWLSAGEVLQVASPMLVSSLALFAIAQADIWVLGTFRSQEEVAIYGAAARVVLLVAMPILIVNAIISPPIAEMYAQGRKRELERLVRTTVTLALLPTLAVLMSFMLLGSYILGVVYGEYYRQGATVLVLLSVGYLANVWAGPSGTALVMTGHQTTMMMIAVLSGVFVICGALLVVQDYGAVGVAGVAATSMILQNALALLFVKKRSGFWTHASFSMLSARMLFRRRRG